MRPNMGRPLIKRLSMVFLSEEMMRNSEVILLVFRDLMRQHFIMDKVGHSLVMSSGVISASSSFATTEKVGCLEGWTWFEVRLARVVITSSFEFMAVLNEF